MSSSRKLIVLSLKWYDVRIHQGVLEYAKGRDWDVVASPHESQALDIPTADGQIVMLGPNDLRRTRLTENLEVPVVDIGRYSNLELPRVCPDNVMAGRLAAREFISRGFSRFAVFSTKPHWYVEERRRGFNDALAEKGLTSEKWHQPQADLSTVAFAFNRPDHVQVEEWLAAADKPIAIYAIEDESAAMLMRSCHQQGLAMPEQVAFISNNNDPVICPYTEVPLSSIDLNWEGVGYEAAARLDLLLQGRPLDKQTVLVPPKGLVARKSSDTVAVKDLRVAKAISYIQENSRRHVAVTEIVAELEIPLRTLQWAFKRSLDCSIQDVISKRRVDRITDMLLNTDRNVGQIADDLGFSSAQYMHHFFVKTMDCTPNEYRKQKLAKVD